MTVRYGLFAALASGLLALGHGVARQPSSDLPFLLPALLLGLAGRMVSGRLGERAVLGWKLLWLLGSAVLWVWATGVTLEDRWSALLGVAPAAWHALRYPAISTSLLLGGLWLVARALRASDPISDPLCLLLPAWVALTAGLNPAGDTLIWLPLLVASGVWPSQAADRHEQGSLPWQTALAMLIEVASLQCVAWGLAIAVLTLALEIRHDWLAAFVVSSGAGVSAWLLSGLLWGLGEAVRQGRFPLGRWVARFFGVSANRD